MPTTHAGNHADALTHELHAAHEWPGDKGRIVVGGAGDQSGSEQRKELPNEAPLA